MTADCNTPTRGEIWLVRFDPSVGDEIKKERPAIVLSIAALTRLQLRIVVPLTGWQPAFSKLPWHRKIQATAQTGLTKDSSADALQVKSVSLSRFKKKLGTASATDLSEIAAAVQMLIDE